MAAVTREYRARRRQREDNERMDAAARGDLAGGTRVAGDEGGRRARRGAPPDMLRTTSTSVLASLRLSARARRGRD